MLFDDTPKALADKIEQVVRLIRSKGVGVYFVTQSPTDIPESILGQLGNRVQHALRAFTPKDQKAVKVAAETFRANPSFDTAEAIMNLGTGEALVSFLDANGAPGMVQKTKILFPLSQIGAIDESERSRLIKSSRIFGKYDTPIDRESAFEVLLAQAQKEEEDAAAEAEAASAEVEAKAKKNGNGLFGKLAKAVFTAVTASVAASVGTAVSNKVTGKKTKKGSGTSKVVKSATSAATRTVTRELTRSILGNLIK